MKQIHKAFCTACLLFGVLLLAMAAWASPAFAKPGNKVTGHYIRDINPEVAWEMSFNAHEAVTNRKGRTRPAKGYAMGTRILHPSGEPLFWVMAVTCTVVFDENYARFAGVVINHADPDRIGEPIAFEAHDYATPGNGVDHLWHKPSGDFGDADCPTDNCTAFEYAQAFCEGYSDPPATASPWYVTEGNIRVHFAE